MAERGRRRRLSPAKAALIAGHARQRDKPVAGTNTPPARTSDKAPIATLDAGLDGWQAD